MIIDDGGTRDTGTLYAHTLERCGTRDHGRCTLLHLASPLEGAYRASELEKDLHIWLYQTAFSAGIQAQTHLALMLYGT
jgi:hypothetical protein